MSLSTVGTLVLIGIVAVVSPILADLTGRLAIPGVVFEIALGILIGPAILGLAHPDSVIVALEDMGLSYLMFLAGLELDLQRIRGRSLELAATGWMISLTLASATALPLIVVITTIGVEEGRMRPVNAAALMAAGVLSVLLYPTLARMRLRRTSGTHRPLRVQGKPAVEQARGG